MNMFGVNHVYNADYNTFMLFFFHVFQFVNTCVYNMNISTPAPANIDELPLTNYIIYLLGKKKKERKKEEVTLNITMTKVL